MYGSLFFCMISVLGHIIIHTIFLLVIPNPVAFLLNVTSTVMFWMSACQSILCTVHLTWSLCYPRGLFYSLMLWSCCRQVDLKPWQCSPHDMFNVRILVWGFVCGFVWCAWLSGRQSKTNRIPQKKNKIKYSTQQLWKWKWKSKCAVAILLDHFSVLLWCVVSHFKNMNGVTFFFF